MFSMSFLQPGHSTVLAALITVVLLYLVIRITMALEPRRRSFSIDSDSAPRRPMPFDGHTHAFDVGFDDADLSIAHAYFDARCQFCHYTQRELDALRRFHDVHHVS